MISNEHKAFLKKKRLFKYLVLTTQLFVIIALIVLWQFLADNSIINTFISSSPRRVWETIVNLHKQNNLYNHIFITIYETTISFVLGTIIGVVIASIMWANKFIAKVIDPYLTILNSLPKVALGPILIIWVGANINSIIMMALLISVITTTLAVYNGFISTNPLRINLLKSFNATKLQIYRLVMLPNNYPTIVSTLKINLSLALVGVIMGEFLVSKEGIGYLIMYGSQVFNLNLVITGVIILAIVSYLMYLLINYIEILLIKER